MADWDLSCPDWQERIRDGRSLVPDLPLFQGEADAAVAFFDALRLPDVPGKPLFRTSVGDWFRDIVRVLFGARNTATNIRHIREVFALVPKGSSKTTNSAGLMVTALLMNDRPDAEYLFVGPTQTTADRAFNQAAGMIRADEQLEKRFQIREHIKEIKDRLNGARMKVKTFDVDILTGAKPVGVLLDEIHLLGKNAQTTKVMRQIRGGLEKNSEGFLVVITTQSDEPPQGAFYDELMMARKVRDGQFLDGRMLPVLYEFPPEIADDPDRWQDPSTWSMVMPNLGRSVHLESLQQDWRAEREKGRHAIAVWASQHLNLQIGLSLRSDRWAGADFWQACSDASIADLEAMLARCEVAVVGIDGGGLDDLLGLAVLGREKETRRWLHWGHAWGHECVLERRKDIAAKLRDLESEGSLTIISDDSAQDVEDVADIVQRIEEMGLLAAKRAIGVDPVGISDIVDELERRGFEVEGDGGRFESVRQGWTLSDKIKVAERRLAARNLIHGGSALMSFAVSNAKVEPRGNAISITKQTAGSAKIDPLMALFNAVSLMDKNPVAAPDGRLDDFLKNPLAA